MRPAVQMNILANLTPALSSDSDEFNDLSADKEEEEDE
jgi:hypothetical protein